MAVLDRPANQKQFTSSLVVSVIMAVAMLVLLLLVSASSMAHQTGAIQGGIGGLKMFQITRQPAAGGGYADSVSFLSSGLAMYFGGWLVVGLLAGYLRRAK